ncbi:MAG: (Fe-S)-binding protein [Chloroflexi bacterium]|nr:(Fe-S)-binding protein [Chloroflexota bacterium]
MPQYRTRKPMIQDTRTIEEKLDCISREGNLSTPEALLKRLLWALGIEKPREEADYLVLFGCYGPYRLPFMVQRYLSLLERLGVRYTYLTKEHCCGVPVLEAALEHGNEGQARTVREACKNFMAANISAGRARGARNTVYLCTWCAHMGKKFFPEDGGQFYCVDLLLEKLEKADLEVAPTVVGYYEGCHLRNQHLTPGIELDWAAYREVLNRIKGLQVVDLNPKICCTVNPGKVVDQARKLGVKCIVSSCRACHMRLLEVGKEGMRMQFLPDLLFDAVVQTEE